MISRDGYERGENNYCRIVNVPRIRYSNSALATRLNILILLYRALYRAYCTGALTENAYAPFIMLKYKRRVIYGRRVKALLFKPSNAAKFKQPQTTVSGSQ